MLDSKDLRIGNFYNYKFWNPNPKNPNWEFSRVEIVGVLKNTFYFKTENDNRTVKIGELHPIPISEEWLIRFGFEKNINGLLFIPICDIYDFELMRIGCVYCTYHTNKYNDVAHSFKRIEFLHQLQNLYFALTGKELELKS